MQTQEITSENCGIPLPKLKQNLQWAQMLEMSVLLQRKGREDESKPDQPINTLFFGAKVFAAAAEIEAACLPNCRIHWWTKISKNAPITAICGVQTTLALATGLPCDRQFALIRTPGSYGSCEECSYRERQARAAEMPLQIQ